MNLKIKKILKTGNNNGQSKFSLPFRHAHTQGTYYFLRWEDHISSCSKLLNKLIANESSRSSKIIPCKY